MHILIGLAIATVLIILWARGNLFACVFLSIPPGLAMLVFMLQHMPGGEPSPPAMPLTCIVILTIIWTPRYLIQRRIRQRQPTRPRPVPRIPMPETYVRGVRPWIAGPHTFYGRISKGARC